ncbi:MAG: hypothetical protein GY926_12040 [bacterium]|nr:hypothetical protein [bacterium]
MARHNPRRSGARSNRYSESRLSNWAPFDPWESEVARVYRSLRSSSHQPQIHKVSTHPEFLMPLRIDDVNEVLDTVGPMARQELQTILLLGGTNKQLPFGRGALYGAYYPARQLIAVHAFPKHRMQVASNRPPSPTIAQSIRRVGGEIKSVSGKTVVSLDEPAVGRFLKWHVLVHEIAHHIDRHNPKTRRKTESFAEWFTTSVGFSST